MDKLQFEYPADFMDDMEVRTKSELPPFKASAILYVASSLTLFAGIIIPLLEMASRPGVRPDTFIELLEWNPFSQLGMFGIIWGLFLFWLGVMTDRRGA